MGRNPNIVWITLESTRWDHTSVGGYSRDTTPNISKLAARETARSFDACFAPGIWTRAVSGSILTGTYPSHHGAGISRQTIPDTLATVPELLDEVGYRSVAISPNANLSEATGLDRGFDDFVWLHRGGLLENVGVRTLGKFLVNLRRHGGGFTTDTRRHNTGYMMTDVAKRWLGSHGDSPFFMYLHYGDPHHPYYPPLPRLRREAERQSLDAATAGELALDHHTNLDEHVARGLPYTVPEWETLRGLYDAGIEYADHLVGHLLDTVEQGAFGETIVVVTADHGELFGENGLLGHKVSVHDALAHVPMVVDGLAPAREDDSDLIQHIDVMQTLLDEVGADTSQFQGVELGQERRTEAFVQRGWDRCERHLATYDTPESLVDRELVPEGDLTAIRTPNYKYCRGTAESLLFDLPDEETDVSGEYPDVVDDLEDRVSRFLDTQGRPVERTATESELSADAREQLTELGYLVD